MENVQRFVPEEEDRGIELYTYWKIVWRKRYYVVVPIVLSLIITLLGIRQLTPIYESFSMLSIEEQNIFTRTMERYITPTEDRHRSRNQQFQVMIDMKVKSRDFLELIATELGLDRSKYARDFLKKATSIPGISERELVMRHLISLLKDKIEVENPVPEFYRLTVYDTDPNTAYVLAKTISERYIDVTRQLQLQGLRQAGAFSDEQLAIYKEKLEASEKELAEIRREMMETDIERNPVASGNINVAEARSRSLRAQIGRSGIELNRVRERLVSVFGLVPSTEMVTSDEAVKNLEKQINTHGEERLLAEISEATGGTGEDVISTGLWEELRRRIIEIIRKEYSEFSSDLHPLIAEYFYQRYILDHHVFMERKLQGYIDQFNRSMARRPFLEQEFNHLSQEVETNGSIYRAFLESKTSTQISEAIQSTNLGLRINIIEKAEKPITPVKPNKLKIALLALVFAVACGIGSILVTEYIDDSFRTIEEVQRILKVPVLGTVPKTVASFAWEKRKKGRMVIFWIIGIFLFTSIVSGAIYIYARSLRGASIGIELVEEKSEE